MGWDWKVGGHARGRVGRVGGHARGRQRGRKREGLGRSREECGSPYACIHACLCTHVKSVMGAQYSLCELRMTH